MHYPSPDALDTEIMLPDSNSAHVRACGKWIEAASVPKSPSTRAFANVKRWQVAVNAHITESVDNQHVDNDVYGKFVSQCMLYANNNRMLRNSLLSAYHTLKDALQRGKTTVGKPGELRSSLLRQSGILAAHGCESTVLLNPLLNANGKFVLHIKNGHYFSFGVLRVALEHVGDVETSKRVDEVERMISSGVKSDVLNYGDVVELVDAVFDEHVDVHGHIIYDSRILQTLLQLNVPADDYFLGLAAFCAITIASALQSPTAEIMQEISLIQSSRPAAASLGRLSVDEDDSITDNVVSVGNNEMEEAVTVIQVARNRQSSTDGCRIMSSKLFSGYVDRHVFEATVTPRLYNRLEEIVDKLRVSVAEVVSREPFNAISNNASLVAHNVHQTRLRIAGAPRYSWAGLNRDVPSDFDSRRDLYTNALKQAKAVVHDRLRLVLRDEHACEHSPFLDSRHPNAYVLVNHHCIVHLNGLAIEPFLNDNYDDWSIYSRGGAIMAHEFAHVFESVAYKDDLIKKLLVGYQVNTLREATADVIAALAVLNLGVEFDYFMSSWCQMWCTRLPKHWLRSSTATHPQYNDRCDSLYVVLKKLLHQPHPIKHAVDAMTALS
jgi:hypothetical protein